MKKLGTLSLFVFVSFCANAQIKDSIKASCDTFTLRGYVIFSTRLNSITNLFDTYYGFLKEDEIGVSPIVKRLISKKIKIKNSIKSIGLLTNCRVSDYNSLINQPLTALIISASNVNSVISSLCDTTKTNLIHDYFDIDIQGQKFFEIPNAISHCHYGKSKVYENKPMISIRYMELKFIYIYYNSFETYRKTQLSEKIYSHPLSFCANYNKYIIDVKPIKNKRESQQEYKVLCPILRVN